MTEAQMREVVAAAFVAGWTAGAPGVPFAIENETLPSADRFALLTVTLTTAALQTQGRTGTRRERTQGWIQVELRVPANEGTAGASTLASVVRGTFRMVELPGPTGGEPLRCGSPVTQPVGVDGRWYMQIVRVPFWYVETV